MNINESPDPRSSMWAWCAFMLRFLRMRHGMSGDDLAKLLNCARSSISRLENNEAQLSDKQAAVLDEEWNTGGMFAILVHYARLGHEPNWLKTFNVYEELASMAQIYNGQLVPAYFQTPAYARELLIAGRTEDLDKAVDARIGRQTHLRKKNPLEVWAILAETVLQVWVGGSAVMCEQLIALLEFSRLPNVVLRVVPNSAGANLGLDGSFKIFKVREKGIAFVEAANDGRLVMDLEEVESFRERFDRIGAMALPVDSSRRLIEQHVEALK